MEDATQHEAVETEENPAGETNAASNAKPESAPAPKKTPKRKAIWIMVPTDIEDLQAEDFTMPELPEVDEEGKKAKVHAFKLPAQYHMYVVPAGPGQKAAIRKILKEHNVDLRTIHRVRMYAGEKKFAVETQYNIRF